MYCANKYTKVQYLQFGWVGGYFMMLKDKTVSVWEDNTKMGVKGTEQTAWTGISWLWTGNSGRLL